MEQIAHYRVKSKLGAGGMGEVYLATDEKLGRDVALKLLPDAMTADATARARLVREARTASALNHPNICHIYEVGEAGGHAYIAMERVEGRPLSQSIPSDGLPIETVLRYAGQLADALAHAHDRGVLHRDLKSANVMVTPEGRVKILDFGLAKRAPTEAEQATRSIDTATKAGSVAGTLHYLAPEVLRGQAADARSDIWAAGVVLYEMATGRLPFGGATGFEVSAAILRESPAALPARVPAGLRAIVMRCLAKEPAQRYQRAGELRAAIEAISSDTATAPIVPQLTAAPAVSPPALPSTGPRNVQGLLRRLFRAGEPTDARESLQVLGIWFLWILGLIVLFAAFMVVSTRVKDWLNPPSQPAPTIPSSATAAMPPDATRLSTGGKRSPVMEANSYFEKSQLFLRGQFDVPRARDMLEKALELDPKFADARAAYALTALIQVESGLSNETAWVYKAEQEVQQALRDDPDSVTAQSILGAVYMVQGRKELGREQLQRAFERDPRQLSARVGLIHNHRMSGDYSAGIPLARQTLEIMPVFMICQMLLGSMLHESGDAAAAVQMFGGILEQDPQHPFALRELAHGHIETGDTRTARIFLEKIRQSERQNYRARLSWALLYAREGRRRDAIKEMDAEVQKYAEINPNVTLEAAEFYALLGEKTKALDWLEKAVRNGDERTAWFQRDSLLESIRGEFRFKSLLESIAFRRQQAHP